MSMTFTSSISFETYTVQTGDLLSTIAQKFYGDGSEVFWTKIYEANKAVIGPDPTKIAIGMVLVIPSRDLRAKGLLVAAPDVVMRVLELVNQRRSENGLAILTLNDQLTAAAQEHCRDMADHNFMGHNGSDGSTPWDRIQRAGYHFSAAAENVAAGYATPESVMDGWMNETPPDDGHRRNILGPYRDIGIGYAFNDSPDYKHYWAQDFGSP